MFITYLLDAQAVDMCFAQFTSGYLAGLCLSPIIERQRYIPNEKEVLFMIDSLTCVGQRKV